MTPSRLPRMPQPRESHPAIEFRQVPIAEGPLTEFDPKRAGILDAVAEKTMGELSAKKGSLDLILGEALYSERQRLKREKFNFFTRERKKSDLSLWGGVQKGLLKPSAIVDRKELLAKVIHHYSEEIGGHFNPKIYNFAIRAVPWGFSWILNAASVQRFLPWGMTQSLESRVCIGGEIEHLQKLSKRGTILLVPTHQSNVDSPLIGYVIYLMSLPPFAYGAGLNLFSNPVLSFFMSRLGAYTVDRRKNNGVYKQVLKNYSRVILREGVHSVFFPGGGRSRSGSVESRVKLGLLGTGLEAQIDNYLSGKPQPNIYVVPMITSYNFVLEASSLIEDYLAEAGKARFIITDDESWQVKKVLKFFWKLFSAQNAVTIRIGKPMDVFGNFVDPEGHSIGPNGTTIDPAKWFTTRGRLCHEPKRDREYTVELGERVVERFHRDNTVLSSHLVAFTLFETLRKQYPDLDIYRFLRLSLAQRSIPLERFLEEADRNHRRLREAAKAERFYLSDEIRLTSNTRAWVDEGVRQLGIFHDAAVVKVEGDAVFTEDMNLLYYYRNRLSGYGLSLLSEGKLTKPGEHDQKGFLA